MVIVFGVVINIYVILKVVNVRRVLVIKVVCVFGRVLNMFLDFLFSEVEMCVDFLLELMKVGRVLSLCLEVNVICGVMF